MDQTANEVLEVFAAFYQVLCDERDVEGAMALWATDEDIVLHGSEARDAARGPQAIRAHLGKIAADTREISFAWREQQVHVEGEAAWVSASGTLTVAGHPSAYQSTGVFVRREDRWLWHTHSGSEPHAS